MKTFAKTTALSLFVVGTVCMGLFGCKTSLIEKITIPEKSPLVTDSPDLVVKTTSGRISGYIDRGIYVYKGIPYAKAERFMAPEAPTPWEGVRSCCAYGPTSPQGVRTGWQSDRQAFLFDWDDGFQGEDCLRLNVWSGGVGGPAKRPVMVWLHGGGYSAGSSQELPSYDGWSLADKGDVVLVSVNHRLNVLGFLDLSAFGDKYAESGNAGMCDIVKALEWVKANIAAFGGDPSNVTIFGQSGGGGKVSTLMAMPSAKGLFHKAIVQSGSMGRSMEQQYSRRIGVLTIEELGLKSNQLDRLSKIPYEELLKAGNRAIERVKAEIVNENVATSFLFGWMPTVDGVILPAHPFDVKAPAQSADIPMMIGTTLHEFMFSSYLYPNASAITTEVVMKYLNQTYGNQTNDFVNAFEKAYPSYSPRDLMDVDTRFRPMALAQANLKSAQKAGKVYMYLFTWESPVFSGSFRASHCAELPFVFNNIAHCRQMTGGTHDAYLLAEKMSDAWLAFARTGNPNCSGLPQWPAYDAAHPETMIFDNHCHVVIGHDADLMRFVADK